MSNLVAQAYGDAIFQIGKQHEQLEQYYMQLHAIKTVVNDAYLNLMNHPHLSKKEKCEMIDVAFSDCDTMIKNFLKVLIEKNRFKSIVAIIDSFDQYYYAHHQIQEIFVTSAIVLSKQQEESIQAVFAKKYQKKIKMNIVVDKTLIAGLIVRVNDEIYDNSVLNQLSRLKESI